MTPLRRSEQNGQRQGACGLSGKIQGPCNNSKSAFAASSLPTTARRPVSLQRGGARDAGSNPRHWNLNPARLPIRHSRTQCNGCAETVTCLAPRPPATMTSQASAPVASVFPRRRTRVPLIRHRLAAHATRHALSREDGDSSASRSPRQRGLQQARGRRARATAEKGR